MKNANLFYLLLCLSMLFSCGKAKKAQEDFKDAKEGLGAFTKMAKEAKKMTTDIEDLASKTPLTNDQFKEWMPETVGSLKRTGFKNNPLGSINVASSEATYKDESKNQNLKVTIIDGAGTGSVAIAGIRMATAMDMEEQNEYGYKKTVKKEGIKAVEEFQNSSNKTNLTFLYKDRFAVTVDARGMNPEEVWKKIDELDLNKLNKIAG